MAAPTGMCHRRRQILEEENDQTDYMETGAHLSRQKKKTITIITFRYAMPQCAREHDQNCVWTTFRRCPPPPSRPYIFILCVHYKRCRFPKTYTADEHNSAEVCRTTTRRFRVVGKYLYIVTVNSRQLGEIASWVYAVGLTLPTTSGNI